MGIPVDGKPHKPFKVNVDAVDMERTKAVQTQGFEAMEVHESVVCHDARTKFFMFGVSPGRTVVNALFLYVTTWKETSPEQLTAFLIYNGTIGYCESSKQFRYVLQDTVMKTS